jgi:hypothetical protein
MARVRRGPGRCLTRLALLTAWMLAPAMASAQADAQQKAAAEALFDEAYQLLTQGQYENACRRFEQSQEIDPGVGTLLYLGDCFERSGKTASAWATFREASSAALAAGQADRARMADERARKLSPTLSRLVLLVPQEDRAPGFELLLDGKPLSPALFGSPFPVNPGQREITARAPGLTTWSYVAEVKPNADYRSVQVPVLAAASSTGAVAAASASSAEGIVRTPPMDTPSPAGTSTVDHTLAFVVGGAGLAAIGVGVIFGVRAADKDEESKADCPSSCSTEEGAELNQSARTSALVSNISYGVGIAAIATSIYLYFSASPSSGAGKTASTGLQLGDNWQLWSEGPGAGLVSLSGGF